MTYGKSYDSALKTHGAVMADESFDMQSEMVGELSTGDLAGGGLRAMFEAAGVPTDRESIDVAISGIPAYSLAEGVSGGRLSEMLEGLGQEASIEELITSMTDLPVEEAALAATAMGAMSPGSRFRSIGEALEEITKRVRDYFTENPRRIGPNEQRRMRHLPETSLKLGIGRGTQTTTVLVLPTKQIYLTWG